MSKKKSKRYQGLVQNVRNSEGNVRVDVKRMDTYRMQPDLLVRKMHPGMVIVPKEGWLVDCERTQDGDHFVLGVVNGTEAFREEQAVEQGWREEAPENEDQEWNIREDLEPGTFVFQLDKQSGIKYTWNEEEETYDLTIRCGGDLTFSAGGSIEEKTTEYEEEDEFTSPEDEQ